MKSAKRILLFPGGPAQREAFIAARELGLYIIGVDRDIEAACSSLADDFYPIDPYDIKSLLAFTADMHARKPLSGVLLVGCDIPESCAAVGRLLNSPTIAPRAAALTVDKFGMKQVLRQHGVPVPDFFRVSSAKEVEEHLYRYGKPMIIKPNDNSGARGVQQLKLGDDCMWAFEQAQRNVRKAGIILEAYEPGLQISIEGLSHAGNVYVTGIADRNYEYLQRFYPHIIENGATLPTQMSFQEQQAVVQVFCDAVRALGIEESVAKGDMVLGPEGPKVIEIAGRISGGKFASMIVPESSGVRLLHAALQVAIGEHPDDIYLRPHKNKGVAVRYFFAPAGELVAIEGKEEARNSAGVKELVLTVSPKTRLHELASHADRAGWVVCVGESRQEAVERAEAAVAKLRFIMT